MIAGSAPNRTHDASCTRRARPSGCAHRLGGVRLRDHEAASSAGSARGRARSRPISADHDDHGQEGMQSVAVLVTRAHPQHYRQQPERREARAGESERRDQQREVVEPDDRAQREARGDGERERADLLPLPPRPRSLRRAARRRRARASTAPTGSEPELLRDRDDRVVLLIRRPREELRIVAETREPDRRPRADMPARLRSRARAIAGERPSRTSATQTSSGQRKSLTDTIAPSVAASGQSVDRNRQSERDAERERGGDVQRVERVPRRRPQAGPPHSSGRPARRRARRRRAARRRRRGRRGTPRDPRGATTAARDRSRAAAGRRMRGADPEHGSSGSAYGESPSRTASAAGR